MDLSGKTGNRNHTKHIGSSVETLDLITINIASCAMLLQPMCKWLTSTNLKINTPYLSQTCTLPKHDKGIYRRPEKALR